MKNLVIIMVLLSISSFQVADTFSHVKDYETVIIDQSNVTDTLVVEAYYDNRIESIALYMDGMRYSKERITNKIVNSIPTTLQYVDINLCGIELFIASVDEKYKYMLYNKDSKEILYCYSFTGLQYLVKRQLLNY